MVRWDYSIIYYANRIPYVNNRWEFHISYEKDEKDEIVGWTDVVLNRGARYVSDDTQTDPRRRYSWCMINQHPALMPLSEDGTTPLDRSDPTATFHWLHFKIEPEVVFSVYGIPDPLPGPFT